MIYNEIVFVILHYMAIETTKKCVQYIIENIDTEDFRIVIVDNNSPDGSGELLSEFYNNDQRIYLLHSEKNLGFTGGNNLGIRYARDNYKFHFLVVLNNDVFLLETAFSKKLDMYYKKYKFAVAGPHIMDRYGASIDYTTDELPTDLYLERRIAYLKKIIRLDKYNLLVFNYKYMLFKERLKHLIRMLSKKEKPVMCVEKVMTDVKLHGCFWIFTENYFLEYSGLKEKTAFFCEEETLLYRLRKKGLLSVYIPDILVIHMEDASTNASYKSLRQRLLFLYKNEYLSWLEYMQMINEDNG